MKLTPIEKVILIAIVVCFSLLVCCVVTLSMQLEKVSNNGGLKSEFNKIWNGKTNQP